MEKQMSFARNADTKSPAIMTTIGLIFIAIAVLSATEKYIFEIEPMAESAKDAWSGNNA